MPGRAAGQRTPGNLPLAAVLPEMVTHLPPAAVARPCFCQTGWGAALAALLGLGGEASGWRRRFVAGIYLSL